MLGTIFLVVGGGGGGGTGLGMAIERDGAGGWDLHPRPAWLLPFPVSAPPRGVGQTTLPHPRPLGTRPTLPLIQFYIYK